MAKRIHLFPSRTQKLSSYTPMVLGWRRPGRVGSCRIPFQDPLQMQGAFSLYRCKTALPAFAPADAGASDKTAAGGTRRGRYPLLRPAFVSPHHFRPAPSGTLGPICLAPSTATISSLDIRLEEPGGPDGPPLPPGEGLLFTRPQTALISLLVFGFFILPQKLSGIPLPG